MRNPLDLDSVRKCERCPGLSADHVPSAGNPHADVMIVGRDPGAQEVEVGSPFVGPCGDIINYVLDEALLDRSDIYLANAVKCHTPNNRGPHPEELTMCSKMWLRDEIKSVKPKVLVLLGKDCHSVIRGTLSFGHLDVHQREGRVCIVAYHPGYILRMGTQDEYIPALGGLIKKCLDDLRTTT